MNRRKAWMSLVCAIAPVSFAQAQLVDSNAEIEVSDWNAKSVTTWTADRQLRRFVDPNR